MRDTVNEEARELTVLVVDDDFMVARVHSGFVEKTAGFTVVGVAHSGADALESVRRLQPDLVLLDIYLPDANGLELLQELREIHPNLDVVVISAAREMETVRRALHGGIVHYLMKPFSQADLTARLDHYREAYSRLHSTSENLEQDDVNRLFGLPDTGQDRPPPALPKGCSVETMRLVELILARTDDDVSAARAAESLGVSRVAARRYLEYLVGAGRATVRLNYGGIGRPERRYARAGPARP